MKSYEKIAQLLRTDKDIIRILDEKMSSATGKKNVIDKIVEENKFEIEKAWDLLNLNINSSAKDIYDTLISKVEADDLSLYKALGEPKPPIPEDWQKVLKIANELVGHPRGFFLKKEKAIEFLKKKPPSLVMEKLGYNNVEEMLAKEDLFEIFSSLRFVQGAQWLNDNFLPQYVLLTPDDFEEREITPIALPTRWAELDKEFVKKKYHNISHLKEMGAIFVIPLTLDISGETLRNFSLILHYFSEVKFYSDLFKKFAREPETFGQNIISLIRGDVLDSRLPNSNKAQWMIVQRYLAKDDENDWRLFEPHVNPEALHWLRAERMLVKIAQKLDHFSNDVKFWNDLDWAGDYFKTDTGIEVLVSFNLIDTSMSLAMEKFLVKYLYHHQEALWNKIFMEYLGEEKMEELIMDNIIRGYFEV